MADFLCGQLKLLADAELWESATCVAANITSLSEHNSELLSDAEKYQVVVFHGYAHYHLQEYQGAESKLRTALQLRKFVHKSKGNKLESEGLTSEVDVKYKLAQCCIQLKDKPKALQLLDSIPAKQRTVKVNMALAQLQKGGVDRAAISAYREVLRECPLALECVDGLLSHGVAGMEVSSLIMSNCPSAASLDWLSYWIKAKSQFHSKDYEQCITSLTQLESRELLRGNVEVQCMLGEVLFTAGLFQGATECLDRAQRLDPFLLRSMELLARMYTAANKIDELQKLCDRVMSVSNKAPQSWLCLSHQALANRQAQNALQFAQHSLTLTSTQNSIGSVECEGYCLKGDALVMKSKYQEALLHYKEAMNKAPYRFEPYKGAVNCYLFSSQIKDAGQICDQARYKLNPTPRVITLYASVLRLNPSSVMRARNLLEKTLRNDPTCTEAVYNLVRIYEGEEHIDLAIDLLKRQLRIQNDWKLHQMLGDFLHTTNEYQEALDQYHICLSMDPHNETVTEAIAILEQKQQPLDNSPQSMDDLVVEEEADQDASDFDPGAWSDTEIIVNE